MRHSWYCRQLPPRFYWYSNHSIQCLHSASAFLREYRNWVWALSQKLCMHTMLNQSQSKNKTKYTSWGYDHSGLDGQCPGNNMIELTDQGGTGKYLQEIWGWWLTEFWNASHCGAMFPTHSMMWSFKWFWRSEVFVCPWSNSQYLSIIKFLGCHICSNSASHNA